MSTVTVSSSSELTISSIERVDVSPFDERQRTNFPEYTGVIKGKDDLSVRLCSS